MTTHVNATNHIFGHQPGKWGKWVGGTVLRQTARGGSVQVANNDDFEDSAAGCDGRKGVICPPPPAPRMHSQDLKGGKRREVEPGLYILSWRGRETETYAGDQFESFDRLTGRRELVGLQYFGVAADRHCLQGREIQGAEWVHQPVMQTFANRQSLFGSREIGNVNVHEGGGTSVPDWGKRRWFVANYARTTESGAAEESLHSGYFGGCQAK
ncbi:hypothetical protein B0H10DRAFT_1962667 [Mycena sp. CBHHK59/15]|nr:hypothetical protein B0H10DRAFT_1962667 [Mycena sp. CBHHK59/15]